MREVVSLINGLENLKNNNLAYFNIFEENY